MAQLEQGLYLFQSVRQSHQHRRGAVGREPVALVRPEFFRAIEQLQARQPVTQRLEQFCLVGGG
ncbi:hypothetical protein D3C86_2068090 [compost metagenome]